MNDKPTGDPGLESLAARLAAHAPRLPQPEQDRLLYQCAYAAGQAATARKTRRWQVASAALAVVLVGLSIPAASERLRVAWQAPPLADPPAPVVGENHSPKIEPEPRPATANPTDRSPTIALDAWQLATDRSATFAEELAKVREADPSGRLLSTRGMSDASHIP
ncbi:MAG: hypothetical protein WD872_18170 [Pirellulaceae bacterium]